MIAATLLDDNNQQQMERLDTNRACLLFAHWFIVMNIILVAVVRGISVVGGMRYARLCLIIMLSASYVEHLRQTLRGSSTILLYQEPQICVPRPWMSNRATKAVNPAVMPSAERIWCRCRSRMRVYNVRG
jgi:hypothetical protein